MTTIGQLEALVTQRLQMVFEEIRSDADFDRLTEQYARAKKDPVFATMRFRFDDAENPTYGALVQRKNVADDAPDRFVAVIDCRGEQAGPAFFHPMARDRPPADDARRPGCTEPAYRSEHDPIETDDGRDRRPRRLLRAVLRAGVPAGQRGKALLTFDTVKAVMDGGFPAASFQATLNACTKRLPTPVVYLEAALAHKKEVKRRIETTPGLFGETRRPANCGQ